VLALRLGSLSSHAVISKTSVPTASKVWFNEHPSRRVMALLLSALGAPHALASPALYAEIPSRQHFLPNRFATACLPRAPSLLDRSRRRATAA
jgi:hypothetical protein